MSNLFVYGTLMFEEVIRELVGTMPIHRAALAKDVTRPQFEGQDYPGLVECPGRDVSGLLFTGLRAETLLIFDKFEGSEYERRPVQLAVGTAEAYFVRDEYRDRLSTIEWDPEAFRRDKLEAYLEICRDFASLR